MNIREGICPIPGCGKDSSRLDRHLSVHTELSSAAKEDTLKEVKRRKILKELAQLRESNPMVPMVSTLDLQTYDEQLYQLEDPIVPQSSDEEDGDVCSNPRCQKLKEKIADLNRQVDTLTDTVREITQRYRRLQKRTSGAPRDAGRISRVTKSLLSSLGTKDGEKKDLPAEPEESPLSQDICEPTTSQQAMEGDESSLLREIFQKAHLISQTP
ncbi:MAG: hypothetical protein ACRC6N_07340 [Plesiomonas sp.]|uniref:hypothetical protein n=1 Tax=Plesiomonas sp. TaxID=2486279 RepID=UPI003F37EC57